MIGKLIFLVLVFSDSIILKVISQSGTDGPLQTDEHILGVVDLMVEEKKLRQQLEASITQFKNDHDQLQQEFNTRTSTLEADVLALQQSLTQADQKNQQQETLIQHLQRGVNQTDSNLEKMMIQLHKVYVTACASSSNSLSSGQVVVFPSRKTSNGFKNVSLFTSSGTFTAEEAGLYFMSVTIRSQTSGSYFRIYKNTSYIVQAYVGSWYSSTYYESGTGVAVVELNAGDNLNVKTGPSMYVQSPESCVTIVKIK